MLDSDAEMEGASNKKWLKIKISKVKILQNTKRINGLVI